MFCPSCFPAVHWHAQAVWIILPWPVPLFSLFVFPVATFRRGAVCLCACLAVVQVSHAQSITIAIERFCSIYLFLEFSWYRPCTCVPAITCRINNIIICKLANDIDIDVDINSGHAHSKQYHDMQLKCICMCAYICAYAY